MPPEPVKLSYEHITIRKKYDLALSVIADMMETRKDFALEQMIGETYTRLTAKEDPKRLAQFKKRLDEPYPVPDGIFDDLIPNLDSPDVMEEAQRKRQKKEEAGVTAPLRETVVVNMEAAGSKQAGFEAKVAKADGKQKNPK